MRVTSSTTLDAAGAVEHAVAAFGNGERYDTQGIIASVGLSAA